MRKKITDGDLIFKFICICSQRFLTLREMGVAVGKSKNWAFLLVTGKTKKLRFNTRNRVIAYLEKNK